MTLKKDKQKVLGENFDDERIKTFLHSQAPAGVSRDYSLLETAYRGMIPDNFATFVGFFVDAGLDINAKNPQGKTFLQEIRKHRHAQEYIDPLLAAGAE